MFDQEQNTERNLTAGERSMLQRVFNGQINLELVKIRNYDPDNPDNTRSFEGGNVVHLLGCDYADDISLGTMSQKATLVHEVAHVWQHQKTGFCSGQEDKDAHFRQKAYDAWHEHTITVQRQIEARILDWSDHLRDELARSKEAERADVRAAVRDYHSRALKQLYNKRDSLQAAERHARAQIADDKFGYLSREAYDPVLTVVGPLDEFESQPSHVAGTTGSPGMEPWLALAGAKPMPNERLSDFMWRDPKVQTAFATKSDLRLYLECNAHEDDGSGTAAIDYNYMMKKPGAVGFFELRVEAQAQLITEYFLLKNGTDPRTIWSDDMNARPPLSFYEKMIPFVATPVKP